METTTQQANTRGPKDAKGAAPKDGGQGAKGAAPKGGEPDKALATTGGEGSKALATGDWLDQLSAGLLAGDQAAVAQALAKGDDVRLDAHGGEKMWVKARAKTQLAGKILTFEDRVDDEGKPRRDYVFEILRLPTDLYLRGSDDPNPEEGRQIVELDDGDGNLVRYAKARIGDVVSLSENHNTRILVERIGCTALISFRNKVKIDGGKTVWRMDVFTAGTPKVVPGAQRTAEATPF